MHVKQMHVLQMHLLQMRLYEGVPLIRVPGEAQGVTRPPTVALWHAVPHLYLPLVPQSIDKIQE